MYCIVVLIRIALFGYGRGAGRGSARNTGTDREWQAAEGAATIGEALPIAPVAEAWEVRRLDISKKHEQTLAILAQLGAHMKPKDAK